MKCQRCHKPATLHITEVLTNEKFEEFHFCEHCSKKYLYPAAKKASGGSSMSDDPGNKGCSHCGIKFVEFRNTGRLGCPHDYDIFNEELLPLLESIHGEIQHCGKAPAVLDRPRAQPTELERLRIELDEAVAEEAYEAAARLRDRIKNLEMG